MVFKFIREKVTPPLCCFSVLLKMELPQEIKGEIGRLLEVKVNTPEVSEGEWIDVLNDRRIEWGFLKVLG